VSALAANLLGFGRLLRRAGLPVGPAESFAALAALGEIEIGDRRQVYAALRATMVRRREHFEVFDQAFQLYWRDPEAARYAAAMEALDGLREPPEKTPPASRRLAEAMAPPRLEARVPPVNDHSGHGAHVSVRLHGAFCCGRQRRSRGSHLLQQQAE
jgi:uncharacterized protein with von Willebrand factor type A (vWA) domain